MRSPAGNALSRPQSTPTVGGRSNRRKGRTRMVRWNPFPLVGVILFVVWFVSSPSFARQPAQSKVFDSGLRTAQAVGANCTADKCSTDAGGCASCIDFVLQLPPEAWVTKTRCFTTASYPDDLPRHEPHEVPCGADVSFSRFDTPIVAATKTFVEVRSVYHNRSSDRARDAKMTVEWQPISTVPSNITSVK